MSTSRRAHRAAARPPRSRLGRRPGRSWRVGRSLVWTNNKKKRHKPDSLGYNMFGYVVYLYGGPVAFAAKRLKVVAHSSAEAEYAAASYSSKEVAFVRNVCLELGVELSGPVCLGVDNTAAITIANNRGVTGRTKHFSDAIHNIRHMIDHLIVRVRYVPTRFQLADAKALAKPHFRAWCGRLLGGVCDSHS